MEDDSGLRSNQCFVAARVGIDQHASTIKPFYGGNLHQALRVQMEQPIETGLPARPPTFRSNPPALFRSPESGCQVSLSV